MRRWIPVVLGLSLALNLFLAGLVVYQILMGHPESARGELRRLVRDIEVGVSTRQALCSPFRRVFLSVTPLRRGWTGLSHIGSELLLPRTILDYSRALALRRLIESSTLSTIQPMSCSDASRKLRLAASDRQYHSSAVVTDKVPTSRAGRRRARLKRWASGLRRSYFGDTFAP